MRTRPFRLLVVAVAAVVVGLAALGVGAQQGAPAIESIRQADLKADLYFLASDGMRGRLTDTPGNALAAEFIKARFERLGLKPSGPGGSFYQEYNLVTAELADGNSVDVVHGPGHVLHARAGVDFYPQSFSASATAEGPVSFVGYGIVAPGFGHDDYRGDVAGRIVLALDHEPGERDPASVFDGVVTSEPSSALRKALAAQDRGAAAILFVSDVHNHAGPVNFPAQARSAWPDTRPRIPRYSLATWVDRLRIPAVQISPALAATLVAASGRTLEELARSADRAGGVAPAGIPGVELSITTSVTRHVVPDRNVVASIESGDPKLAGEVVIVCAHYDHNGADEAQVFNGADDDGSGVVALLEIAEAYALAAEAGRRPRRSVLFAAWNSEERGLLGAWAYTEAPLWPLDRTVGVLNMDMVGRHEEVPPGGDGRFRGLDVQTAESNANAVNVIGTARSASMRQAVEQANRGIDLTLRLRYDNNASNLMRRSDHWPFLQRGVPALWFHSGLHPDYHTRYDRPEKIEYGKMERIARLVYQTSWSLADRTDRPTLDRTAR